MAFPQACGLRGMGRGAKPTEKRGGAEPRLTGRRGRRRRGTAWSWRGGSRRRRRRPPPPWPSPRLPPSLLSSRSRRRPPADSSSRQLNCSSRGGLALVNQAREGLRRRGPSGFRLDLASGAPPHPAVRSRLDGRDGGGGAAWQPHPRRASGRRIRRTGLKPRSLGVNA